MKLDEDRIDDAVLALLYLGCHDVDRAWKGFDWDAMDRLHEKGLISEPRSKAKAVSFTEEGLKLARERCEAMFGVKRLSVVTKVASPRTHRTNAYSTPACIIPRA